MAVRKTAKGAALKRWFKEDWKDVSTGKACGRKKGDGRSTPYCRPSKRVSTKTPKTSGEMTAAQKKSRIAQKKSLGQPAGKPRRVASLTRRNTVKKMKEGGMLKAAPTSRVPMKELISIGAAAEKGAKSYKKRQEDISKKMDAQYKSDIKKFKDDKKRSMGLKEGGTVIVDRQYLKGK